MQKILRYNIILFSRQLVLNARSQNKNLASSIFMLCLIENHEMMDMGRCHIRLVKLKMKYDGHDDDEIDDDRLLLIGDRSIYSNCFISLLLAKLMEPRKDHSIQLNLKSCSYSGQLPVLLLRV